MNILKEFDLAIVKTEGTTNGYRLEERIFDSYLSNRTGKSTLQGCPKNIAASTERVVVESWKNNTEGLRKWHPLHPLAE